MYNWLIVDMSGSLADTGWVNEAKSKSDAVQGESWLWLVLDTLQCLLWFWWWWRWWWSWWLHISAIYILYTIIVFVVIVSGVSLWCRTGETFGSSTYTDPGLTPISDSVPRANWVATDEGSALQSRKKEPVPLLPGCLGNSLMRALD